MESFNPRTHKGCDNEDPDSKELSEVSIHAPTKGATFSSVLLIAEL